MNLTVVIRIARYCLLAAILVVVPAAAEDRPSVIRIAAGSGTTPARPFAGGIIGYIGENRLLEQEFAADGIPVEWVVVKGAGPGVNEAFATGTLDFGQYGDLQALIGRTAGIRTRILLNTTRGGNAYLVVPKDSPAHAVTDLVGKRISLHKGRPFELGFHAMLEDVGLNAGQVRIFNLAPQDGQMALAAGRVDGHFSSDGPLLEATGVGRVLWSTRGGSDPQRRWTSELFVLEDFAARHPTIVERVVRVFLRAYARFSDEANRAELYDLLARTSPREVVDAEWQGSPLRSRNNPLLDDYLVAHYQKSAATAKAKGLMRGDPGDLASWFDPAPLRAALQAEGLTATWTPVTADGANLGF